jgi:hypothetical protein
VRLHSAWPAQYGLCHEGAEISLVVISKVGRCREPILGNEVVRVHGTQYATVCDISVVLGRQVMVPVIDFQPVLGCSQFFC